MESFDRSMSLHQIEWRKANVAYTELGRWPDRQYQWILHEGTWEESLWPSIRTGSEEPLPALLTAALCNPCLPRTGPEQLLGYREDLLLKTWPFPYS